MADSLTLIGADRRSRLAGIVLVNGGLTILLSAAYVGSLGALVELGIGNSQTAHAVATLCVALAVVPLRRRLWMLSNRLLRVYWQDGEELLRDFTLALSRTIEPEALHALLADDLPRRLRLDGATLWMLEPPDDLAFVALDARPVQHAATLLANGTLVTRVREAHPYLLLPDDAASALAGLPVALLIPLRIGDRLIGIYGLGRPCDGGSYPPRVLAALTTLAPAVASALENTRTYTQIARLNARLRALDRTKTEFIESMGHELRTPLTSLRLAVQLLTRQPELAHSLLPVVHGSTTSLGMLVDRVLALDVHRAEVGNGLASMAGPVELLSLLEGIAAEYLPGAHAKGLRLVVAAESELAVWCDGARLRRALHEVVDNAVRYSERGTVRLAAHLEDGLAVIAVSDEGPGIPHEEHDLLFDAFYRGRNTRAMAETPGAGLGLSLARRDIEALGGRIWLEHTGPQGSTMCVALRALVLAEEAVGAPA